METRGSDFEAKHPRNEDGTFAPKDKNSVLTSSGEGGIIGSRGEVVALEYQRYGRNKDTLVNKTYIESGEYRRKFDNITDNPDVNRALYQSAKEALIHRSGTKFEDMYWIDEEGKVVLSVTDSDEQQKIKYNKQAKNVVKDRNDLVTLHTHPASMPPSDDDLDSNYNNGYKMGVVACHNGRVFVYHANERINKSLYLMYISQGMVNGMNEFDAQMYSLRELSRSYDIEIREV